MDSGNFPAPQQSVLSSWKKLVIPLLVLAALGGILAAAYFYNQISRLRQNPSQINEADAAAIIERVGKLIVLPEDERPTIATVADLSALKNQPFFAKAKIGDKVLLYAAAHKAILYDPVENKLVEVAPIATGAPAALAPVNPAATSRPRTPTTPTAK